MKKCIDETSRRRKIQEAYNEEHHIIPKTIQKEIAEDVSIVKDANGSINDDISVEDYKKLSAIEKKNILERLEKNMKEAAKNLKFEEAMQIRDIIFELKGR